MILKTKLKSYEKADPNIWLGKGHELLDHEFAGRLAKFCKDRGKAAKITRGFATYAEQKKLHDDYLAGKLKSAAAPGTSWHEFRLAVDVTFCIDGKTRHPLRDATNAELKPYGLCKPIASEGWHIQPIETGKSGLPRTAFAPIDIEPQLTLKFKLTKVEAAYIADYKYAEALADGLLSGKKDFSAVTLEYLGALKPKLGL